MAKLESITIKGFKSIREVDKLEFRDLNVVIGPNGAGKSNFLGVFSFLQAIREGKLHETVIRAGGADNLLHFGAKETGKMSLGIWFDGEQNGYEISLIPAGADGLRPLEEVVYHWNKATHASPFGKALRGAGTEALISASLPTNAVTISDCVRNHLASWRLYHFHDTSGTSPMKRMADVNDNRFLRPDGSNVAPILHLLQQDYPENYKLVRKAVQRVAPFFDDFQLEPLQLNPGKIQLEWRHKRSDRFFDATTLSDGTLRFLSLATLFLQPTHLRPSVILVDEPELGLHPFAITLLAAFIKQAATETQVILATQSPLLLDNFCPQDVLVVNQVDGATGFERLDTGRLTEWLEVYSLGQLWEKNEIAGRPVPG